MKASKWIFGAAAGAVVLTGLAVAQGESAFNPVTTGKAPIAEGVSGTKVVYDPAAEKRAAAKCSEPGVKDPIGCMISTLSKSGPKPGF